VSQTLRVLSLSARARAPLCEEELAPFLFFLEREVREKRDVSEKKNAFYVLEEKQLKSVCRYVYQKVKTRGSFFGTKTRSLVRSFVCARKKAVLKQTHSL